MQADFEYYLPKRAILDLDFGGTFILTEGEPSEIPLPPESVDGAMRLADIYVPAFTFKPTDVRILREKKSTVYYERYW